MNIGDHWTSPRCPTCLPKGYNNPMKMTKLESGWRCKNCNQVFYDVNKKIAI